MQLFQFPQVLLHVSVGHILYTCRYIYATYTPIQTVRYTYVCMHTHTPPTTAHINMYTHFFEGHTHQVGGKSILRQYSSIATFLIQQVALGIK